MTGLGKKKNLDGDIMATLGNKNGIGTGIAVIVVIVLVILIHLFDCLLSARLNELYPCNLLKSSSRRLSSF